MPKKPNPRRIKLHRVYTPAEAAEALELHKQTVLRWIKVGGLNADQTRRPWLIEGAILRAFLEHRRSEGKCKLKPEEIYCLPCRKPQLPAGRMADFRLTTATTGQLIGLCPDCERTMQKAVSRADLEHIKAVLDVTIQRAEPRIIGEGDLSVSVTSREEPETNVKKRA